MHYYRHVQDQLGLARQAYDNNGCDLTEKQTTMIDFYEYKDG